MLREQFVQLRIEVYWHRGESLVIVRGDLDGVSAADLSERLLEIDKALRVLNGRPRRLVVGLAEVGFANQAAVRVLAATRQELAPECQLLLQSPSRAVRKVLAPAGLLDDGPSPTVRPPVHLAATGARRQRAQPRTDRRAGRARGAGALPAWQPDETHSNGHTSLRARHAGTE